MATLLAGVDVPLLDTTAAAPPVGSSLDAFIAALTGKIVGGCGGFPTGQCTALACLWARNLGLGTPCGSCSAPHHCDGACWAGSGFAGWTWVPNTPNAIPSPGDIVAYHANCAADGIGADGHVGIVAPSPAPTASAFTGFDQNWCNPSCACELHAHDYACVIGWQHPTGVVQSSMPSSGPPFHCGPGQVQVGSFCYPEVAGYGSSLPALLFVGGLIGVGIFAYERSPRIQGEVRGLERRAGLIRSSRTR